MDGVAMQAIEGVACGRYRTIEMSDCRDRAIISGSKTQKWVGVD